MSLLRKRFTQRHKCEQKVHSAKGCLIIAALFVCFLLPGCQEDNGEDFRNVQFVPTGVWADDFGGSYIITRTELEFDDGFGFDKFEGTIETAVDFSRNSGVLIIKITTSDTGLTEGNYIGVYYRNYSSSHILLANAIDASFAIIEAESFNEAESIFSAGNVNTHVTFWGSGYTK